MARRRQCALLLLHRVLFERGRGGVDRLGTQARETTSSTACSAAPPIRRSCRPVGTTGAATCRYVITLDADTRLPIGCGKPLVGKISHPLNQPRLDVAPVWWSRVTASCSREVFQLPVGSERWVSLFQRVFAAGRFMRSRFPLCARGFRRLPGLVRQGSYCGKGIYDMSTHLRRRSAEHTRTAPSSATICWKEFLRPRGPCLRHRSGGGVSLALRRLGGR